LVAMIIDPPDSHYFLAAEGWLELGNPKEALNELKGVSKLYNNDPDFLELLWKIYAELKDWEKAYEISLRLIIVAPERPSGWINRSYCLHEMKETQKAYDLLLDAAEKFPSEEIIAYNLACYSCQLGKLDEAQCWLTTAFLMADKQEEMKEMALSDPDLKPIWDKIKNM